MLVNAKVQACQLKGGTHKYLKIPKISGGYRIQRH